MEMTMHVRFDGTSFDIPLSVLDIGDRSNDRQIKSALAGYLDVTTARFNSYVVERHANGNLTIRPEAVFG